MLNREKKPGGFLSWIRRRNTVAPQGAVANEEPVLAADRQPMSAAASNGDGSAVGQVIVDRFDHIYCLNLDHRRDRWQEALAEFSRYGLEDAVERISGVDFRNNARFADQEFEIQPSAKPTRYSFLAKCGCIAAHRRVLQDACDRGFERFLLFEDDIRFLPESVGTWRALFDELDEVEWDRFFLGATYDKPLERHSKHLLTAPSSPFGNHASAYSRRLCLAVLEQIPEDPLELMRVARESFEVPGFDVWMSRLAWPGGRIFCSDPLLAVQRLSPSDITNRHDWDIGAFQRQQFATMRPGDVALSS